MPVIISIITFWAREGFQFQFKNKLSDEYRSNNTMGFRTVININLNYMYVDLYSIPIYVWFENKDWTNSKSWTFQQKKKRKTTKQRVKFRWEFFCHSVSLRK